MAERERSRRMRKRIAIVLGILAAVLLAAPNAVVLAGRTDGHVDDPADCALVLGARVFSDGTPSDILRDRLDEGVALFRAGRVRRVLVSGDHGRADYDEPDAMRAYLEAHGVPRDAVVLDHAGFDTYSSMWRAKNVFGAQRIVVVTQRFHLARALWLARHLDLDAEGRAADRRVYRGIVWLEAREIGSRAKAVFDVTWGRRPRFTS